MTKRDDERSIERMIRSARIFSGDNQQDQTPVSDEEAAIMAEIKAAHRRPTADEIKEMARRLAREK